MNDAILVDALRESCEKHKNIARFARALGVSRPMVSEILRGNKQPGKSVMFRMFHYSKEMRLAVLFFLANGNEALRQAALFFFDNEDSKATENNTPATNTQKGKETHPC